MGARNQHQADAQAGFAVGKKVWFKAEFDAQRAAKAAGAPSGIIASKDRRITLNGEEIEIALADGTAWVPVRHLRLTPPPGLAAKEVRPASSEPRPRKGAIDPSIGVEMTIFDFLP